MLKNNESYNHPILMKMVTRKAPKQIHYSAFEGSYNRVTTAVSKKNKSNGYIVQVEISSIYIYMYIIIFDTSKY